MPTSPDPVRLLVVTDWDAGFSLRAHPPLLDVDPGANYVTEIVPGERVAIHEALVERFALTQISVGERTAQATAVTAGERRIYKLGTPLVVDRETSCRLLLCNDTAAPLKPKDVAIVRYDPTARTSAMLVGQSQPIRPPSRIDIQPSPNEERQALIETEVDNLCGFCGQIFQMVPGDPHKELIDRAFANEGRGPICPEKAR